MPYTPIYNIVTSQRVDGNWQMFDIVFSITSKKKAQVQMETIIRLTKRGEWFVEKDKHFEVYSDRVNPIPSQPRFLRDITIRCLETNSLFLYRLIECPVNNFYIKL